MTHCKIERKTKKETERKREGVRGGVIDSLRERKSQRAVVEMRWDWDPSERKKERKKGGQRHTKGGPGGGDAWGEVGVARARQAIRAGSLGHAWHRHQARWVFLYFE